MNLIVPENLPVQLPGVTHDEQMVQVWLATFSSPHTQDAYSRDIRAFRAWVQKPLEEVTAVDAVAYDAHLRQAYKPASAARKLAAVKSLFSMACNVGYLRWNVWRVIKTRQYLNRLDQRILSQAEVQRLIAFARPGTELKLLFLLYYGGLRVSEAVGTLWQDLAERQDLGSGQITVFGKGDKPRTVPFPARIWQELMKGMETESKIGLGFLLRNGKGRSLTPNSAWRMVKRIVRRAGIDRPVSPHFFRHAHATHAIEGGAPLHVVQRTLGHASLTTTDRYLHVRPDDGSSLYLPV